jgi:hypothetical protein
MQAGLGRGCWDAEHARDMCRATQMSADATMSIALCVTQ